VDLVKKIKDWCTANYEKGGSWIIETFTDEEIAQEFKSLAEAKRYCKRMKDREDEHLGW
jgi:hypothetical protein